MRKLSFFLVFAVLLTGCGKNYLSERAFWKANREHQTAGRVYLSSKNPSDLEPAVQAYLQVIEKYPGTSNAVKSHFVIANLRVEQERYDQAREILAKVIQNYNERKSDIANARYAIAGLYEKEGNWEKAEEAYWELTDFHPLQTMGLYAPIKIISHHRQTENSEEAERAYAKALDFYEKLFKHMGPIRSSSAILYHKGLAHLVFGEWIKAREIWLQISEEYSESEHADAALMAAANLSFEKQDLGTAVELYQEFIQKFPKHEQTPKTTFQLGMTYIRQKDYRNARKWFNQALEYYRQNPIQVAELKLLIGRSYQEEGLWEEAVKIYDEIQADYGKTSSALQVPLLKAIYYEESGDVEKSHQILDEAISGFLEIEALLPAGAHSDFMNRLLNRAYAQKGDWNELIDRIDQKIEEETVAFKKGNWLVMRGLILENHIQDNAQAIKTYQEFLHNFQSHPMVSVVKNRLALIEDQPASDENQQPSSV